MIFPSVLAALAVIASSGQPRPELAFRLGLRGDLADASAEAARVLAASPKDPIALLVAGCVAIERNELDRATAIAAKLEAAGSPRGAVLRRLAERRRSSPREPMAIALAEAWRAAGAPDLAKDLPRSVSRAWSPEDPLLPTLAADAVAALTPAERLALQSWPESGVRPPGDWAAQRERSIAAASAAREYPLWVDLLLIRRVRGSERDPADLRARAVDAERVFAEAASALDPQNGYYGLISVVAGADEAHAAPLAPAELDALEAAIAAPRFVWPRELLRDQLAARLRALDPAYGELRAALLYRRPVPLESAALQRRVEATVDAGARARAGRVLAGVARRLAQSTYLFDRAVGGGLDEAAAKLSGDENVLAQARSRGEALWERQRRMLGALERLGAWPLVSTSREPDREGEVAGLERLAR